MSLIRLTSASRVYDTGKVKVNALDGVDLAIEEGEFVAIMGQSGSGKSTLLNILGFLDKPDGGTYLLFGRDITGLDDDELSTLRNRVAGFVFQQFNLLPKLTALKNAALPLVYAGSTDNNDAPAARLADVGLAARGEHLPGELSGGEQQRVAIARALVNGPPIIFADEPTGNLDTRSEEEIMAILERLNAEGKTIIMVTHEQEIARRAGRIIRMRDGKIISDENRKKKRKPAPSENRAPAERLFASGHGASGRAEFLDYLRQATASIFSHKLRSLLSITGILIGVAAVISMMALGEGAQAAISEKLSSLGSNMLMVRSGAHHSRGVTLEAGNVARLTLGDGVELARIASVSAVSPSVSSRAQLVFGGKNRNSLVQGVGTEYETIRSSTPTEGRFFTREELRRRAKVALVGTTVVRELFGKENPVGQTIKINRINFTVIGVLPVKGQAMRQDQDDMVLIPVTTAMYRLMGKDYLDSIDVQVAAQDLIESAKDSIIQILARRHRLETDVEESFDIMDLSEMREAITSTTRTMSLLLGIVAAISLLVGGIGIMNIMLVTVKERVKEIGLRKAIGARKRDIRLQFLIESAMLTFTGGIAGVIVGVSVSVLITVVAGWTVVISAFSILLSTTVSILIGVTFGLWPAVQASRLNPIEALRWE
ncbi:MAG: ABC transporter permease [Spirochaetes bacterium]|nr:ABC transporter permease [Spirochaetota bacterium]